MNDQLRFTAVLKDVTEDNGRAGAAVKVSSELAGNPTNVALFMPELYLAIIRAMKDTSKDAFYTAMGAFAEEDMEEADDWIRGQLDD